MLNTNPLFGGSNKVQVLISNGDKVPLTYSSSSSNGDSIWTGQYTIPTSLADGLYTYTIEASQSYLQTDIATHFDSPPSYSENTGIVSNGTFKVGYTADGLFTKITDIGLIKSIPDKTNLLYYFTSTNAVIKGITNRSNRVYFVHSFGTSSTLADNEGNFTITLSLPKGTNQLEYYAISPLDIQSSAKTLNLIIGTENFPTWLVSKMNLLQYTDTTDTENTQEETNEEEPSDENIVDDSETEGIIFKFLDSNNTPLLNAIVEIDSNIYTTDSDGEITVKGLDITKKYIAKVSHNGIEYEVEVLGIGDTQERIQIQVTEDDVVENNDWKSILMYVGMGLVLVAGIGIVMYRLNKGERY